MSSDPAKKLRIGVLISGRGSNMKALLEAAARPGYPVEVAVVISNRPGAGGLAVAGAAGIPAVAVDHKAFPDRVTFEAELDRVLDAHGVEFVCLAGFMRLLTDGFVTRRLDRLVNIHPSLLPSYKGVDTHERVLAEGGKLHGCTVHFVRPAMDEGPIILQAAVTVREEDTPDTLAARVLAAEHVIYPAALQLVAEGRVKVVGGRTVIAGGTPGAGPLVSLTP